MVISGPIPAGSPDVSARGFAMRQRHSIIAALRMSCRYAFDFASYFSAYIFSRISFFFGVSTVVGFLAHSAAISTPCFVTSGAVKWPIGVLSSPSRRTAGISAGVFVTVLAVAEFG